MLIVCAAHWRPQIDSCDLETTQTLASSYVALGDSIEHYSLTSSDVIRDDMNESVGILTIYYIDKECL